MELYPDEDGQQREEFLLERLGMPGRWLYVAKATRAHIEKRHHQEASNLIMAGLWNQAHQVFNTTTTTIITLYTTVPTTS